MLKIANDEFSLLNAICKNAQRYPEKLAAQHNGESITYKELVTSAQKAAKAILALTEPTQPVLICLPNSIDMLVSMLACMFAGVCFMPIKLIGGNSAILPVDYELIKANLLITNAEIIGGTKGRLTDRIMHLCVLNESKKFNDAIEELTASLLRQKPHGGRVSSHERVVSPHDRSEPLDHQREAPLNETERLALMVESSGSTGSPKCAQHTFENLDLLCIELVNLLAYENSDISLLCLPTWSAFCITSQIFPAIYAGATLLIHDSFDRENVLKAISEENVTRLYLYGPLYREMVSEVDSSHKKNKMRSCVAGAEFCHPSIINEFREKFGLNIIQSMGMIETLAHSLNMSEQKDKIGSAGLAICGAKILIQNDNGHSVPRGELGEIVIDSPTLMHGYFGTVPIDRKPFSTGDIGYIDEDGYLWFIGRKVIGQDLHRLREVHDLEIAIYAIKGVTELALIRSLDATELTAFICIDNEADAVHVTDSIKRLSSTTVQVKILDSLPRVPGGKADLSALQRLR